MKVLEKLSHQDIKDLDTNEVYLRRWHLVRLGPYAVMLHHIRLPDADRCPHDHPWAFLTLILKGGYTEEVGLERTQHKTRVGRFYYRPASFKHRIMKLPKEGAWTLVFHLTRIRDWGFWTETGKWMHWAQYCALPSVKRILWCEGADK